MILVIARHNVVWNLWVLSLNHCHGPLFYSLWDEIGCEECGSTYPQHSQVGWLCQSGQTFKRECLDNSPYSLENLINASLNRHNGGGLRLLFFLCLQPSLVGSGLLPKRLLRGQFPTNWQNENPPSTSPSWNIIWLKHKAQKEGAFLWLGIHEVVAVNK